MIFNDRSHAGKLLAQKLQKYKNEFPIILALPRGGVPIGAEIANALNAPLNVLVVRKIGAPFQPELAVGAICEDMEPMWNYSILYQLELEPKDLERTVNIERQKIGDQIKLFRQSEKLPLMTNKTVIIADDGLATGATMIAAIEYIKKKSADKIVVAAPIATENCTANLRTKVDEVIILEERDDLMSVGQWYEDFSQVSDDEVVTLLNRKDHNLEMNTREIEIPLDEVKLKGDLSTASSIKALIIFAHGSGSSRKSPRNQQVARYLNEKGFGTLLFDLLTNQEAEDRRNVFNIDLLSDRLASATKWLRRKADLKTSIPFGFFGASTGAGAAIQAAGKLSGKDSVYAIVSRGGRPDLARDSLKVVNSPVLLLVGGKDFEVITLNQEAQRQLINCEISIIPGATHLFEEPGTLEEVASQAAEWFSDHLPSRKQKFSQNKPFSVNKF